MGFDLSPASSTRKWMGFVTAVWVQVISGNNYTFSNYSDALKSLMSLTQLEFNNLFVARDVGKAFGLLAGVASDRLSIPVVLLIGSVEALVGYGVQWLVLSRKIHPLPYWQMCMFVCMGGNSTTWMNTAIIVTCMRNFRKNRGPVSGILKGYFGLSIAICTALFTSLPAAFPLLLAVVLLFVCLTAVLFLREVPPSSSTASDEKEETQFFNIFYMAAVAAAVYLLTFDVTGPHGSLLSQAFAVVLLFHLACPISIPLYCMLQDLNRSGSKPNTGIEGLITEPLLAENSQPEMKALVEEFKPASRPSIGEDHTIIEAIRTVDFWILLTSFLCGVGTGSAVMNNLGEIGLAMGYVDVPIFVSLISIWEFFGRILSGFISEYFMKKAGTPRPYWNAASQIVMAVGYVVMAMALPGSLYIGSILVGICYGVRLAVTVPIASELFGLKYYALIYNILILSPPIGSFIFSGLLAGFLCDTEATWTAAGPHCYRLVFFVMAFACIIGFGLDILLALRTKKVYARIIFSSKR